MAADQERADRIRALKQGRPDLTWRRIADHVGVTERSATDWQTRRPARYLGRCVPLSLNREQETPLRLKALAAALAFTAPLWLTAAAEAFRSSWG